MDNFLPVLFGASVDCAPLIFLDLLSPDDMPIINGLSEERLEVGEQLSPPERPESMAGRRDDVRQSVASFPRKTHQQEEGGRFQPLITHERRQINGHCPIGNLHKDSSLGMFLRRRLLLIVYATHLCERCSTGLGPIVAGWRVSGPKLHASNSNAMEQLCAEPDTANDLELRPGALLPFTLNKPGIFECSERPIDSGLANRKVLRNR
ncbi:hypothetical protein [Cupriavidus necator]|uniref:hypothetical protein n=1 Tax=Cupriavidus necator TaxID=106590 RepID=UPI003F7349DE